MKKNVLLLIFISVSAVLNAQFISDVTSNRPFYQMPANIQGNPFFSSNWMAGTILTERGIEYSNLLLKFDMYNGQLVFGVNDSMFRFTEPVKEFVLKNPSNEKINSAKFINSAFVHNLLPSGFVQELCKGKVNFYKSYKKVVVELAAYNSVATKQFEDKVTYFIIKDNNLTSIILNKKQAEEIFKDKWVEVASYLEQNQLSAKNEKGWAAAVLYFNSL